MSSAPGWPTAADLRRRRVEQAFVTVVCERGLAHTTVASVCARAGVDEDGFRAFFDDVEDAYSQLFELGTKEVLIGALRAFLAEETYADRLRSVAHAMYRYMAEDLRRARFLYVEVFAAGERAQLIRDQGMEGMYELIDTGRQELEDPDSISRATAEAIGGSILQRIRAGLAQSDLEGLRLSIPRLMYSVVRPYVGEEAARRELDLPPPERVEREWQAA